MLKAPNIILIFLAIIGLAGVAAASDIKTSHLSPETASKLQPVVNVAHRSFSRMPDVHLTQDIRAECKAGRNSSPYALYCSDANRIYVSADLLDNQSEAAAIYMVAHLFGHAVQVRHGLATIALRAIQADRAREADIRGMVTRQVECIAGVLVGRTGGDGSLDDLFQSEPMTDSHWGANPLARGPRVSIGLAERAEWFAKGLQSKDFATCSVGEIGAELILKAER